MAKDPAFLFYPGDYLGGTMGFTLAQHGAYILMLIFQFNNGPFTADQAKNLVGELWNDICFKFSEKDGIFFNKRMAIEMEKRSSYCDSRRLNRLKSKTKHIKHMSNICKSYVEHMEDEDEDVNTLKNKEGMQGGKEDKKSDIKFVMKADKIDKPENITFPFYGKVLKFCNNDRDMAGHVFFRAKCRAEKTILGWIQAGMVKDDKGEYYSLKSIREEDDDPQTVRQWIDTVVNKYEH